MFFDVFRARVALQHFAGFGNALTCRVFLNLAAACGVSLAVILLCKYFDKLVRLMLTVWLTTWCLFSKCCGLALGARNVLNRSRSWLITPSQCRCLLS